MNPLLALQATDEQYQADAEVRRLKRMTAGLSGYAIAPIDWRDREPLTAEEQESLTSIHRAIISVLNPDHHNKPTRDDVVGWSKTYTMYAFFHQAEDGAPVEEFVAGELVPSST